MAANKKGMRIKDVGATINLGNYSSLHVTIGEETEFAGLDMAKAERYLRNIAKSVDGILALPEKNGQTPDAPKTSGQLIPAYNGGKVWYDNAAHSYTSVDGVKYTSVTQFSSSFYDSQSRTMIKKEYMDFASSFGNMVHTAIQNSLIGMTPKKVWVAELCKAVREAMNKDKDGKDFVYTDVEQILVDQETRLAGRFDILTYYDDSRKNVVLWDVKTNADLFAEAKIDKETMSQHIYDALSDHWNVETIFGEHCLQLNLYAYMLEKCYGKKVKAIKIIHVPDNFSSIVNVPKIDLGNLFFGNVK